MTFLYKRVWYIRILLYYLLSEFQRVNKSSSFQSTNQSPLTNAPQIFQKQIKMILFQEILWRKPFDTFYTPQIFLSSSIEILLCDCLSGSTTLTTTHYGFYPYRVFMSKLGAQRQAFGQHYINFVVLTSLIFSRINP